MPERKNTDTNADVPAIADAILTAAQRHTHETRRTASAAEAVRRSTATIADRAAQIRTRISEATDLENSHTPEGWWCSCGRRQPCPVVAACHDAVEVASKELKHLHDREQFGELPFADTIVIPKVPAADADSKARQAKRFVLRSLRLRHPRSTPR